MPILVNHDQQPRVSCGAVLSFLVHSHFEYEHFHRSKLAHCCSAGRMNVAHLNSKCSATAVMLQQLPLLCRNWKVNPAGADFRAVGAHQGHNHSQPQSQNGSLQSASCRWAGLSPNSSSIHAGILC